MNNDGIFINDVEIDKLKRCPNTGCPKIFENKIIWNLSSIKFHLKAFQLNPFYKTLPKERAVAKTHVTPPIKGSQGIGQFFRKLNPLLKFLNLTWK